MEVVADLSEIGKYYFVAIMRLRLELATWWDLVVQEWKLKISEGKFWDKMT
jgi:hypothetical protein